MNNHIKELVLLALSTSILVVQELMFSFLPNIQLTTLLIMVYTYVYGFKKSVVIVFVYVIIDNLLFGSITMFNIVIPMLIGWLMIVTIFSVISSKTKNMIVYLILAYLFGHLYGLIFTPFQAWMMNIEIIPYLLADIPWQVVMGLTNAIAILWLFDPLQRFLSKLYREFI